MGEKKIKFTDLTLRDGHQSLFATRMTTEDMLPIAEKMNSIGFYSMEVWGGATFDVMTRFLNEDPWERVRILKAKMPDTKLQMLLRGQNLVGYRNYADDVVYAFVEKAAEVGIDIFRIFDALNDERNFIAAFKAVQKCRKACPGLRLLFPHRKKTWGTDFQHRLFRKEGKNHRRYGRRFLLYKGYGGHHFSL